MKFKYLFLATGLLASVAVYAAPAPEATNDSVLLNEITVNAPKESNLLSTSTAYRLSLKQLEGQQIDALKDASIKTPNFYIPDYGSKITSSIYIRGIGSRMNEPAMGLYVDNVPYLDKSAFDFNFLDVLSLQLLQGPQGTLYGRNSIGGLMDVHTLSPLSYQGTRLSLGLANYGTQNYSLSHYAKLSNSIGLSLAGFYNTDKGYFKNTFSGKKDQSEDYGGRLKFEAKLSDSWTAALSADYSHTGQRAYPYAQLDSSGNRQKICYNDNSGYLRDMISSGLTFQRHGDKTLFTAATGYQFIKDRMQMDNDFTADSMLYLVQKQKINSLTQEFTLRSQSQSKYQWVIGAFGFYKRNQTEAPMTMESGMISKMSKALAKANNEFYLPGSYKMDNKGAALYHQSYLSLFKNFTLSAGLRLDYERTNIDYDTHATIYIPYTKAYSTTTVAGDAHKEFHELLPKFGAKYDLSKNIQLFATAAKGYKAGGYNYSMLSDILSAQMQGKTSSSDVNSLIYYKPESLWSYELGVNGNLADRLKYSLALFYIDDRDQQIATSTGNGSRVITNADKTESYGAELKIDAKIVSTLNASVAYGYTRATFKDYTYTSASATQDLKGNYVPFVPQNTLSIALSYVLSTPDFLWTKTEFAVQYQSLGKIYWDDANQYAQNFYSTLNGSVTLCRNAFSLSAWIKNALDEDYNTFYFQSLGNSFVQQGRPLTFGATLSMEL